MDIVGVVLFLAIFVFPPLIVGYLEYSKRKKYPIRVELIWQQGDSDANRKWVVKSSRLGYVGQKNAEGKEKGLNEWRLSSPDRPVMGFDYRYVGEKLIWFGMKKAQFAMIMGVMGDKGEEFRPVAFNLSKGEYKPIFEGERAILFQRMTEDFMSRSAFSNWLKDNIWRFAEIAGIIFVTIMLFWNGLQMGDVAKSNQAIASVLHDALHPNANSTMVVGQTGDGKGGVTAGNLGGIPFMVQEQK